MLVMYDATASWEGVSLWKPWYAVTYCFLALDWSVRGWFDDQHPSLWHTKHFLAGVDDFWNGRPLADGVRAPLYEDDLYPRWFLVVCSVRWAELYLRSV